MDVPSCSADMADSSKVDTGKRFSRSPDTANYLGQAKPLQTIPFAIYQFHVFRGDRVLTGEEKVVALALWAAGIVRRLPCSKKSGDLGSLWVHIGTPHLRKDSYSTVVCGGKEIDAVISYASASDTKPKSVYLELTPGVV